MIAPPPSPCHFHRTLANLSEVWRLNKAWLLQIRADDNAWNFNNARGGERKTGSSQKGKNGGREREKERLADSVRTHSVTRVERGSCYRSTYVLAASSFGQSSEHVLSGKSPPATDQRVHAAEKQKRFEMMACGSLGPADLICAAGSVTLTSGWRDHGPSREVPRERHTDVIGPGS